MHGYDPHEVDDVLSFWFGPLDAMGCVDGTSAAKWFTRDDEFDRAIRARFGELHGAIRSGARESFLETARGTLAYVIVLDQFSRNMFRGDSAMFESDSQALEAARRGIDRGFHRSLGVDERVFLFMPFMHAEDPEAQRRCCELFRELRDEVAPPVRDRIARNLDFAEAHRAIVERFHRFPHRNAILGRTSTPDEIDFLLQPGSSF